MPALVPLVKFASTCLYYGALEVTCFTGPNHTERCVIAALSEEYFALISGHEIPPIACRDPNRKEALDDTSPITRSRHYKP